MDCIVGNRAVPLFQLAMQFKHIEKRQQTTVFRWKHKLSPVSNRPRSGKMAVVRERMSALKAQRREAGKFWVKTALTRENRLGGRGGLEGIGVRSMLPVALPNADE